MASADTTNPGPVAPTGVNHIVLNVRSMEESHQFWTELVGLRLVGEFRQRPDRPPTPRMRFYNGTGTGGAHHHDLALVENPNLPPPPTDWKMWDMPIAINHIAHHLSEPRGVVASARVSSGQGREVRPAHRPRHDAQPLSSRSQRLWCGAGVRSSARGLGERYRRRAQFCRGARSHEGAEALVDRTEVPVFGAPSGPPR